MKNKAIMTLVKDIILAAVAATIAFVLFKDMTPGMEGFFACVFAGLPFGWRWASKVITAVSFDGIVYKALFATFLGFIAIFVVIGGDVIRILTAPKDAA